MSLLFVPFFSFAAVFTPSTNEQNEVNGWAYVSATPDYDGVELEFTSTRSFASCFEYRADGIHATGTNPNVNFTDLYDYVCVNNSTSTVLVEADAYVEVRMVFGAESDERFDWTRFDLLESKGNGKCFSLVAGGCNRNWYDEDSYKGDFKPVDRDPSVPDASLLEQYKNLLEQYLKLLQGK